MRPSDIIIGQKYIQINHPEYVYLGVGEKQSSGLISNRKLVIISEGEYYGRVVRPYKHNPSFWNNFEPIKSFAQKQLRDSRGRFAPKS